MEYIAHRINTIKELKEIPCEYGVEIDLRDYNNKLIIQHEPFTDGEDFKSFLSEYKHGTLILNIKSEGIEYKVKEFLDEFEIKNYFFLDSSFPMIIKLTNISEKNIALRLSEYEAIDTIINMNNKAKWVWVDCFNNFFLTKKQFNIIKENKFKICLVSPELQKHSISEIKNYYFKMKEIKPDAICTKRIDLWKNLIDNNG